MSRNLKQRDCAKSLDALSPIMEMPYAVYVPAFEPFGPPHYRDPYRRYATKGHRAAAIKGLRVSTYSLYTYNFDTEEWEEE